jgi:hypothetical protein
MVKHFHFHDLETNYQFDEPLDSEQCVFVRDGVRCRKRCLIGLDLCWIHLRSVKYLRIKDAGLLGKGLFADDGTEERNLVFKIGDIIIEYDGELMDAAQKTQRYGNRTAPFLVGFDENTFYDCAIHRCAASLINHICENNWVRIKAIKRIYNGMQLRVLYNSQLDNLANACLT